MFFKSSEPRLCSFCKLSHRVYLKRDLSIFDAFVFLMVSALFSVAIWRGPDLRSLLIFFGLSFVLQMFYRVRYRNSLKCPHCGFDPWVYRKDPKTAAAQVRAFLENRKENPAFLLKPQPLIEPIYLPADQIKALQESGELPSSQATEPLPPVEEPKLPEDPLLNF